jgi:hypothetical protein
MKKLSEVYKKLGIAFTFPIDIEDKDGNRTYYENSSGFWARREYDKDGNRTYYETSDGFWVSYKRDKKGNETYFEDSNGYWARYEYDEKGNRTYYETSTGYKIGTKRGSCSGKVIEVDGKKYKLMEL